MTLRQPSTRIAEKLPDDAPPLFESVDPDAIDALFAGRSTDGRIQFEHAGHRITVRSSGALRIEATQ